MNIKEIEDKTLSLKVSKKPLDELNNWIFGDDHTLRHKTNGFFSFIATEQNNFKNILLLQNEIGILSIYLRFKNINFTEQEFLLQKKQEPGNMPLTQLSPSVQMTYSNLIGMHGGENKINLINNDKKNNIYIYSRQEQSDSFLLKRNLNILSFFNSELENNHLLNLKNNLWIKTSDLIDFILKGNIIHSDTRSVIFLYFAINLIDLYKMKKSNKINKELENKINLWNFKNQKSWKFLNLKEITKYKNGSLYFDDEKDIHNKRIISGFNIKTNNREVREWDQPLIQINKKIFELIYTRTGNEINILVSLDSSPGTCNEVEFLPTFSYFESEYESKSQIKKEAKLIHESMQSDEGGRFWNRSNLYRIYYSEDLSTYKNKIMISLPQLIYFYKKSNYISMELRSICIILFSFLIKYSWKSQ